MKTFFVITLCLFGIVNATGVDEQGVVSFGSSTYGGSPVVGNYDPLQNLPSSSAINVPHNNRNSRSRSRSSRGQKQHDNQVRGEEYLARAQEMATLILQQAEEAKLKAEQDALKLINAAKLEAGRQLMMAPSTSSSVYVPQCEHWDAKFVPKPLAENLMAQGYEPFHVSHENYNFGLRRCVRWSRVMVE